MKRLNREIFAAALSGAALHLRATEEVTGNGTTIYLSREGEIPGKADWVLCSHQHRPVIRGKFRILPPATSTT
ncbi:hypothetical protein CYG48_10525 [Neorhizobium sp. SOG26]|uniref:hypothetical protein n=1 Tax=Neorhizobium sp. SOG26 TaxID=2060726 RepID=UPI000E8EC8AF|nr:hypothetical protein [Neorhizobium sp. SOG26]AXV16086.1 hypothetical protein CYG48_10525 [Neorhizobium sp. SOG26]